MGRPSPRLPCRLFLVCLLVFATGVTGARPPAGDPSGPGNGPDAERIQQRLERLRAAIGVHRRHVRDLMGRPGVVASGVGLGTDAEPVIRVYTDRLRERSMPQLLDGVPVRAQVSGRIYALRDPTDITCKDVTDPPTPATDGVCETYERWPLPVPIGVSVGHPEVTAGTLGARVTDGTNVYILGNNHVLANVNEAEIGDPALQPGTFDGGISPDDAIATLHDYEPIHSCTTWWFWRICNEPNTIDAAIAFVPPHDPPNVGTQTPLGEHGSIEGYGAPRSDLHPAYGDPTLLGDEDLAALLGTQVQKVGRTTGYTTGSVDTVSATVDVCYDSSCSFVGRFTDQLIIGPGGFSDGGDSGSLIVDMERKPVALLFAGSTINTIANRIDVVLDRFGVTIDDGDGTPSALDLATSSIAAPSSVLVGEPTTVTVTIRNVGTEPMPSGVSAVVTLEDPIEPGAIVSGSVEVSGLAPDEAAAADFTWTPAVEGTHNLTAALQLEGDTDPDNDSATKAVNVVQALTDGPRLKVVTVLASTDEWSLVELEGVPSYDQEMVVACTPNYDLSANGPAIVRVKNAEGTSFEVGLGRPWYGAYDIDHFSAQAHCMVVREGVYTVDEHGVKMEAVRLPNFDAIDNSGSWVGQPQPYRNPDGYTNPVVVGQVVSPDDGLPPSHCPLPSAVCEPNWSVFWSRGAMRSRPPEPGYLYVGRHTGADPNWRPAETLSYVVIEAGQGVIGNRSYLAAVGADTIYGMGNNPPFSYGLNGLGSAAAAVVGQAGMDGVDGGWPVLYGPSAVTPTSLSLAIDEDWYLDYERRHTSEQAAFIVFGAEQSPQSE